MNKLRLKKDTFHPEFGTSAEMIGLVAGIGAGEESATKAQGYHRENMLIIIEEMPGVHAAMVKALENTCTGTNNFILGVGNPDNQGDQLHMFAESPGVNAFRISALDHPNYVNKAELIPGAVSVKSIDMREQKYGKDSNFYKSRVRGISPEEGEKSLFKLIWLKDAENEELTIEDDGSYNAIGIDVANSMNGDKAAVVYGKGNTCVLIMEFQCPNSNHLAYNILFDSDHVEDQGWNNFHTPTWMDYEVLEWSIGIDAVGVGVGTVNTFHDNHLQVISLHGGQNEEIIPKDKEGKPLFAFASLRAQMYWEAREDLKDAKVKILLGDPEKTRMLNKELLAHSFEIKGGKIYVLDKEEVKKMLGGKSPNMSDAFVYWNHMRKGWYMSNTFDRVYTG